MPRDNLKIPFYIGIDDVFLLTRLGVRGANDPVLGCRKR